MIFMQTLSAAKPWFLSKLSLELIPDNNIFTFDSSILLILSGFGQYLADITNFVLQEHMIEIKT